MVVAAAVEAVMEEDALADAVAVNIILILSIKIKIKIKILFNKTNSKIPSNRISSSNSNNNRELQERSKDTVGPMECVVTHPTFATDRHGDIAMKPPSITR